MPKFEISIVKDKELTEDMIRYEDIWVVYGSLEIISNKKKLDFLDNLAVFISYFYLHCLSSLAEIYSGKISTFEFEALFKLVFEPKDDNIIIYLLEEDERLGNEIAVSFKDFADGVFGSVDEYLDYVLELRPDFVNAERTKDFQNKVNEFKNWYSQTFCCAKSD